MKKQDFEYQEDAKEYVAVLNGIEIQIDESDMNEANIARAEQIIAAYPARLAALAEFCVESDTFQDCYPEFSADEVAEKLNMPILKLDDAGGMFTYCDHDLDSDHLIDVEFSGIIDDFLSVDMDG